MSAVSARYVQRFGGDVSAAQVVDSAEPTSGTGEVSAALAVVLRDAVAPGAGNGVATRAVGAVFLAVGLRDGAAPTAFALGEQCLALPLREALTLTVAGADAAVCPAEDFGDVPERLTEVATATGGLAPGDLVVLTPRDARPRPARPGAVELWGPAGSTVTILVNGG